MIMRSVSTKIGAVCVLISNVAGSLEYLFIGIGR